MNTDARSDAELNRIIAEWMGWIWEHNGDHEDLEWYWIDPKFPDDSCEECPSYCTDLNAINSAEEKLNHNQWAPYCELLAETGEKNGVCYSTRSMAAYCATARQRAEALVKVIEGGAR